MTINKSAAIICAALIVAGWFMVFKSADAHEGYSTYPKQDGAVCHSHPGTPKFHCHIQASDAKQQGKEEWGFQTVDDEFEGTSYSIISVYDPQRKARLIVGCNADKDAWLRINMDDYLGLSGLNDDDLRVRVKTAKASAPYGSAGWLFGRASGFMGASIVKDKPMRFMLGDDLHRWYQADFLAVRMSGYSKTIDRRFSLNGFRDALHQLWDACGVPLTD